MRALFYVLSAFAVMGLAIWAYGQNQKTQVALRDVRGLRAEIRSLHEALGVQRAEWAYLNRPQRLRALAEMNFGRLGLLPLEGSQFGQIDEIPYPLMTQNAPLGAVSEGSP
ncbi:MAG: cell division protein FtsL [Rhodobacter sp.]|uniref:cell division protein FtsL n=1 Tax=Pararhodobacter sp. TaxID=2127056 RepID=UPI001DACB4AC|nr:cell division protein FtsL [Pararhodobacter sp.]MCB1345732.1 cell division protein FtsL [Paracoccaceae bacterium]MCC0073539.1 cell division protein FtsL [Rhodobacter sp.]HPD91812.1 cell division protein FtsL [Pararhodobacter sp.]